MLVSLLAAWAIDPFFDANVLQVAFALYLMGGAALAALITIYPEDNKITTNNNLNHIIQEGVTDDDSDEDDSAIRPKSAVEL